MEKWSYMTFSLAVGVWSSLGPWISLLALGIAEKRKVICVDEFRKQTLRWECSLQPQKIAAPLQVGGNGSGDGWWYGVSVGKKDLDG